VTVSADTAVPEALERDGQGCFRFRNRLRTAKFGLFGRKRPDVVRVGRYGAAMPLFTLADGSRVLIRDGPSGFRARQLVHKLRMI
jgi:hypothetical protein